jgi:hypothetical protein
MDDIIKTLQSRGFEVAGNMVRLTNRPVTFIEVSSVLNDEQLKCVTLVHSGDTIRLVPVPAQLAPGPAAGDPDEVAC